ncbi:MAG TPA: hypothetical protein VF412_17770 [Bdellovibrio sp.]|uniref:hypothetical protein n=1 Tax=Bdellovibrio sp. TaxID=28201 RepID=UPI002EDEA413
MKNVIQMSSVFSLVLAMGMTAQAKTYTGVDQNGQACQLTLNNVKMTSPVSHNPCDFDSDGEGPWCAGHAPIFTSTMTAQGSYETVSGSTAFTVNDDVILDEQGKATGFAADPQEGGTVSVKIEDSKMNVYFYFPTSYGKTLSGKEITDLLLKRDPSYQAVWNKIYNDETCIIQM